MLTIFSTLKPITSKTKRIQENAISSWKSLHCDAEVIIYGDDKGVSAICKDYGLKQIKSIRKTKSRIPYVSDIFKSTQKIAKFDIIMYANADMIFTKDLIKSIKLVSDQHKNFLMVGRRTNLDVLNIINFENPQEVIKLMAKAKNEGELFDHTGIDYFIFNKSLFGSIPDMLVGRNRWDNWTVAEGKKRSGVLVDATRSILAIHQNHDYSNVDKKVGRKTKKYQEETQKNIDLSKDQFASILDANYKLIGDKSVRVPNWKIFITKKIDFFARFLDRKLYQIFGFSLSSRQTEIY